MDPLSFTILIAGAAVVYVLFQKNILKQKELDIKQKELDANPDYRMQKALEERMKMSHYFFEDLKNQLNREENELKSAKEIKSREEVFKIEKAIQGTKEMMKKEKQEFQKYKSLLDGIS